MSEQVFLTKHKQQELEQELVYLKTEKRSEILERLAFAKSLGDLSENAEYHSSKEDQGKNEARITQIEAILKDAVSVEVNTDGTIGLGSQVVVIKQGSNEEKTYTLVGREEADLSAGKMSADSPMGMQLMTKKQGDMITVTTPRGETSYIVASVS
jgi:transcription elongation factor GreA